MLGALLRMAVASVVGAGLAFGVVLLVGPALPAVGPVAGSWIELVIAAVIGGPSSSWRCWRCGYRRWRLCAVG